MRACWSKNASRTRALTPSTRPHEGGADDNHEHDEMKKLSTILKKIYDVSKYLQYDDGDKVSVDQVRLVYFSNKLKYPEIDIYLFDDDGINVFRILILKT